MSENKTTPEHIDGLYNFRDVGGLPLTAGGTTRPGVLFRSAALSGLTPAGLDEFAATPIGVVVDFRTPSERGSAPDILPTTRPIRSVNLSILQGAMAAGAQDFFGGSTPPTQETIAKAMASIPALGDMYVGMLQDGATAFAEVARFVAASTDETPSAVLVHCTAGKDRTGVATALLLDAVGTDRAAVVADYASSQEHLAGPWATAMLDSMSSLGVPVTPALTAIATKTPPEAIEQALAWVAENHGSSAKYLASGGLTEAELAALRHRLAG